MTDLSASEPAFLSRLLAPITEVRRGEAATALLLMVNVFLLLAAYYVIKPVREALILSHPGGAEFKAYLGGAIAVALLGAVPAYARFSDRVPRLKLVVGVSLFFASHLVLFYLIGQSYRETPGLLLALGFYVWVGVFNMMVVAQFWSYANDVYTEDQGKRLFPLIALGASVGAALGSKMAAALIPWLGLFPMLLVGALTLLVCSGLFWAVERREGAKETVNPSVTASKGPGPSRQGAFQLVRSSRYLLGLALFALVLTLVNTNGEYLLSKLMKAAATDAVRQGQISAGAEGEFIGAAYGDFFFAVNTLGVILQAFVVSRLVRMIGLGKALFVLPVVALCDAVAVAILPLLSVIRIGKIAENATDYSLNNTLRQMLWLVTSREEKYKAKQVVDTFMVRLGDVASALLVAVLVGGWAFSVRQFALVNALLVALWILVTLIVVREHRQLERRQSSSVPRQSGGG